MAISNSYYCFDVLSFSNFEDAKSFSPAFGKHLPIEFNRVVNSRAVVTSTEAIVVDYFVTDVSGGQVLSKTDYPLIDGVNEITLPSKTGLYFISIQSPSGLITHKVFNRN